VENIWDMGPGPQPHSGPSKRKIWGGTGKSYKEHTLSTIHGATSGKIHISEGELNNSFQKTRGQKVSPCGKMSTQPRSSTISGVRGEILCMNHERLRGTGEVRGYGGL